MKNKATAFYWIVALLAVASTLALSGCEKRDIPHIHRSGEWETVLEPTCTDCGYGHRVCEFCGAETTIVLIEPKGHDFAVETVSPTCEAMGYTIHTCKTCGASYQSADTMPTGHRMVGRTVEVTCDTPGGTFYTCEVCGKEEIRDLVLPTGHHFMPTVTLPTLSHPGYTDYLCECGTAYRGDYTFYSDRFDSAYCESGKILARGLDVSKYNHETDKDGNYLPIDWNAVRAAGFDFVILKAGSTLREGGAKGGMEPTFLADYEEARAAGLDVGAYFFSYAVTEEEILADVELLCGWLDGKKLEYPVYFDAEGDSQCTLGRDAMTDLALAFVEEMQERGFYAGVYSNQNWLSNYYSKEKLVTLCDVWYARYPATQNPVWDSAKYGAQLGMWQYSYEGKIGESKVSFDLDYAYRDYPAIIRRWHLNGY